MSVKSFRAFSRRIHTLVFFVLIAFTPIYGTSADAQGATYYVDREHPQAADRSDHGSVSAPWKTLEYAYLQLEPGDTLLIRGGVYQPATIVLDSAHSGLPDAPIAVRNYPDETVIIHNKGAIRFEGANHWRIEGLIFEDSEATSFHLGRHTALDQPITVQVEDITIRGCEFRYSYHPSVMVGNAKHILIEENYFHHIRSGVTGKDLSAVKVPYMGDDIVIRHNRFEDIGSDGIHLANVGWKAGSNVAAITILGNSFWVNRPYEGPFGNVGENAIDVKWVKGPILIADNVIRGFRPTTATQDASGANGTGVVLHNSAKNVTLERNHFLDNTTHLTISQHIGPAPIRDIVIRNNLFEGARVALTDGSSIGGYALRLVDVDNISLYHNTFYDNDRFMRSNRVTQGAMKNNVVIGGDVVLHTSDWVADANAWSHVKGSIPQELQGFHDLLRADLGLDQRLHPLADSPLIDSGEMLGVPDDFDGVPRSDGAPDIGAFEFIPGSTFVDVPPDHPYHDEIEILYRAGFTAGCNTEPLMYCPEKAMTRAESAVFVERGIHGVDVQPSQPDRQRFVDLPLTSWAAKWADALYREGYTVGCGTDPLAYCPWQGHTRAEGAVLFLRMLHGVDYLPPEPQGIFVDAAPETWHAKWDEAAYNAGLIPACSRPEEPLRFCPDSLLSRGLAAYTMVQARGLENAGTVWDSVKPAKGIR